jgi:hypothetical protein
MADPKQLELIRRGVTAWNDWTGENPELMVDLREANLCGANLSEANLLEANFEGANLRGANLIEAKLKGAQLNGANLVEAYLDGAQLNGANLTNAKLIGANLQGATLFHANLAGADLIGADLSGADLSRANLSRANLSETSLLLTNFSEAIFDRTIMMGASLGTTRFADNDLAKAQGLETCRHYGPSTIGIDTLVRSKGGLPETFLLCCGVPETFITYTHLLIGHPIEFYSCFISYSSRDQAFAQRLHADLQAKKLRC